MFYNYKILIVEDNELNLKILSFWLYKRKLNFKTSLSGEEAVEKFNKEWFDVILLDLMLPGLSGFETTRLIRKTGDEVYGQQPLIIALTANTLDNDRERCLKAGMDDYLSKPFNINEFIHILEKMIIGKNEI